MRIVLLLTLLALQALTSAVLADSPATPQAWMTTSDLGRFLFKMVPAEAPFDTTKAFGVAYGINEKGELVEHWRTEGWYAFRVALHDDGRHLVRFGLWASDLEDHTDLAIAFYDRGKLLKQYRVKDLIKNPDALSYSSSHYQWEPEIQTVPTGLIGETFHLVMIDKTSYRFDIKTGEILSTEVDKGALSSAEIQQQESDAAAAKGLRLFQASPFRKSYEEAFEVSRVEAGRGKIYGVHFEDPEWRGYLTPRQTFQYPAEVHAVFPLLRDQDIEATVTPTQILDALKRAFAHPFIAPRFTIGGASGLRMRITGDRLHWDTPKLTKLLATLTGKKTDDPSLAPWAEMIVDAKEPRFFSFYLNTLTSELVYEDNSKWPYAPTMVDAKGSLVAPKN